MITIRKTVRRLVILLIFIGIVVFNVLYHKPTDFTRTYAAVQYENENEEYKQVSITLDLTIKKKLMSKHLIDGTVEIDGDRYEVSNHLVFSENPEAGNEETFEVSDSGRKWLDKFRERMYEDTYKFNRRIGGYSGYRLKDYTVLNIETTRDFEYLYISRPDTDNNNSMNYVPSLKNYIAPANNMNEVREVSQIFYRIYNED